MLDTTPFDQECRAAQQGPGCTGVTRPCGHEPTPTFSIRLVHEPQVPYRGSLSRLHPFLLRRYQNGKSGSENSLSDTDVAHRP